MIRAASLRPAEGEHRVFVIEEAEDLRDESQNALLKTLEEPAPFAHLILICSEPELLAETILSRCQPVEFAPLAPEAVPEALGASGPGGRRGRAPQRRGPRARPASCSASAARALRAAAEAGARAAAHRARAPPSPGGSCSTPAERGRQATPAPRRSGACSSRPSRRGRRGRSRKLTREAIEQVKRTERRARTQALDLGLALCCAWYRDLAAVSSGADEVVLNLDRRDELAADAEGLDPARAREARRVGAGHQPAPARERLRGARAARRSGSASPSCSAA